MDALFISSSLEFLFFRQCLACSYTTENLKEGRVEIHLLICFLFCLQFPVRVRCTHGATQLIKPS